MTLHLRRPLPLALTLSLAFGALPLWAQAAPEPAAAAAREIRIAAQPLGDALNAWARQAQMQMAVQHALVAGKAAPAVAGSLAPRQALDRLLQGSGLVANVQGSTVSIRRTPEPGQDASLAAVTVTAQGPQDGTTEGTGSSTTQQMNTAKCGQGRARRRAQVGHGLPDGAARRALQRGRSRAPDGTHARADGVSRQTPGPSLTPWKSTAVKMPRRRRAAARYRCAAAAGPRTAPRQPAPAARPSTGCS